MALFGTILSKDGADPVLRTEGSKFHLKTNTGDREKVQMLNNSICLNLMGYDVMDLG
jgi:hypothetical protein